MGKHTFFTGQPVLAQLLALIPKATVSRLSAKYSADRYCKRFMSIDHVVVMLYHALFQCESLRELETGLQANEHKLLHLGLRHSPRRSTMADANRRRPAAFFADLYHALYQQHFNHLPDSLAHRRLFIIDSTTITLFSNVMQGAGSYRHNGRKKGGVKAHMMINAAHDTPSFVRVTEGRRHDLTFLPELNLTPGSTVVFDRAYTNFTQFQKWTTQQITWVTRQRTDAHYTSLAHYSIDPSDQQYGIVADQKIQCGRQSNLSQTPMIEARLVTFFDTQNQKLFHFLTNDHQASATEIAELYKRRWQIELLFKRIKQRYPLKYFLGDTPNAIEIQIWAALICDLLIRIVMEQVHRKSTKRWSYANLSAMVKHHLMTYIKLIPFLINPKKALLHYKPPGIITYDLFTQQGL